MKINEIPDRITVCNDITEELISRIDTMSSYLRNSGSILEALNGDSEVERQMLNDAINLEVMMEEYVRATKKKVEDLDRALNEIAEGAEVINAQLGEIALNNMMEVKN